MHVCVCDGVCDESITVIDRSPTCRSSGQQLQSPDLFAEDLSECLRDLLHLLIGSDGDAQIVADGGLIKAPDDNFAGAQGRLQIRAGEIRVFSFIMQ